MSVQRPTEEQIEARAKEIVSETDAYPEDMRERLLSIKRAALSELVERYDENMEVIAGHYPGWTKEDLDVLRRAIG